MKKDNNKLIISLLMIITVLLLVIIALVVTRKTDENHIDGKVYTIMRFSDSYMYEEKKGILNSYDELEKLLNDLEYTDTDPYDYIPKSSFSNNSFIYYATSYDTCNEELTFNNISIENRKATINFNVYLKCGVCAPEYILYLISIDKNEVNNFDYVKADFDVVKRSSHCDDITEDKPILYLYPKTNTNVTITLKNSDRIVTSYPKYNNGWQVLATPNGDLYDKNNNYYYALYWDEKNTTYVNFNEGFYVTKDNAINFLEEKLTTIGLNDKERNEFIMYWLPKLEQNEQSLVYFELTEERQNNNELIIDPKPDSLLRVNMHIKKVNEKIEIKEQVLPTFERKGFVAVEWGGTIH